MYVADIAKDIGGRWAVSKSGQYAMINAAIGGGVEIRGYVLKLETDTNKKNRYDKSKSVSLRAGRLESFVAAPAGSDAREPVRILASGGPEPQGVASAPTFELQEIADGLDTLAASITQIEGGMDHFGQLFDDLTARIVVLEGKANG